MLVGLVGWVVDPNEMEGFLCVYVFVFCVRSYSPKLERAVRQNRPVRAYHRFACWSYRLLRGLWRS